MFDPICMDLCGGNSGAGGSGGGIPVVSFGITAQDDPMFEIYIWLMQTEDTNPKPLPDKISNQLTAAVTAGLPIVAKMSDSGVPMGAIFVPLQIGALLGIELYVYDVSFSAIGTRFYCCANMDAVLEGKADWAVLHPNALGDEEVTS